MILDENLFDENINVVDGTKINEEKIADKIRTNQDPKEMTKRALNILKDIGGNYIDIAKEYEATYGESPFDGPVEESLNEAVDEEPWTKEEIEKELKSITKNFTKKEGTVRVWMSSEKNDARDILKQNYKYVDVSDGRGSSKEEMSWVIAYSDPKDKKEEN